MMILKVTKKQRFTPSSDSIYFEIHSLGKVWIFLILIQY